MVSKYIIFFSFLRSIIWYKTLKLLSIIYYEKGSIFVKLIFYDILKLSPDSSQKSHSIDFPISPSKCAKNSDLEVSRDAD